MEMLCSWSVIKVLGMCDKVGKIDLSSSNILVAIIKLKDQTLSPSSAKIEIEHSSASSASNKIQPVNDLSTFMKLTHKTKSTTTSYILPTTTTYNRTKTSAFTPTTTTSDNPTSTSMYTPPTTSTANSTTESPWTGPLNYTESKLNDIVSGPEIDSDELDVSSAIAKQKDRKENKNGKKNQKDYEDEKGQKVEADNEDEENGENRKEGKGEEVEEIEVDDEDEEGEKVEVDNEDEENEKVGDDEVDDEDLENEENRKGVEFEEIEEDDKDGKGEEDEEDNEDKENEEVGDDEEDEVDDADNEDEEDEVDEEDEEDGEDEKVEEDKETEISHGSLRGLISSVVQDLSITSNKTKPWLIQYLLSILEQIKIDYNENKTLSPRVSFEGFVDNTSSTNENSETIQKLPSTQENNGSMKNSGIKDEYQESLERKTNIKLLKGQLSKDSTKKKIIENDTEVSNNKFNNKVSVSKESEKNKSAKESQRTNNDYNSMEEKSGINRESLENDLYNTFPVLSEYARYNKNENSDGSNGSYGRVKLDNEMESNEDIYKDNLEEDFENESEKNTHKSSTKPKEIKEVKKEKHEMSEMSKLDKLNKSNSKKQSVWKER